MQHCLTLQVGSEEELGRVARAFVPAFRARQIVLLEGPLGAGKTTLVRAFCRALGVPRDVGIRSPTFTLVNEIEGGTIPIVHADFYRILDDPDALSELGFAELCVDALAFVEWGAAIPEIAQHATVTFTLGFVDGQEGARTLEVVSEPLEAWTELVANARDSL